MSCGQVKNSLIDYFSLTRTSYLVTGQVKILMYLPGGQVKIFRFFTPVVREIGINQEVSQRSIHVPLPEWAAAFVLS